MLSKWFADDVVYGLILVSSVFLSLVFNIFVLSPEKKKYLFALSGAVLLLLSSSIHGLLMFFVVVLTAIMQLNILPKKQVHLASFLTASFFLLVTRTFKFYGLNRFSDVALMFLSLKIISFSCDIKEGRIALQREGERSVCYVRTSDFICYCFCFMGLFPGPFFTYKTFYDGLHTVDGIPRVKEQSFKNMRNSVWKYLALKRTFTALICIIISITIGIMISFDDVMRKTNILHEHGCPLFISRLILLRLYMLIHRLRYYAGWVVSEVTFIVAGFGAYPEVLEPRNCLEPSKSIDDISMEQLRESQICYDTVDVIDIFNCETATETVVLVDKWNSSVRIFMQRYISVIWPFKSSKLLFTLIFSAYWHGLQLGYFITFVGVGLIRMSELYFKQSLSEYFGIAFGKTIFSFEEVRNAYKDPFTKKSALIFFMSFWCSSVVEYMMVPFVDRSNLWTQLDDYKSFYYFGHVYIAILLMISVIMRAGLAF